MRTRFLTVVLTVFALTVLGLGFPLAASMASDVSRAWFADQTARASRIAAAVTDALRTGATDEVRPLLAALDRGEAGTVAVLDAEGRPVQVSGRELDRDAPGVRDAIAGALAGNRSGQRTIWPWDGEDLVVVAPVGPNGALAGAVVTVSPGGPVRAAIGVRWLVLLGFVLVVLGGATAAALILTRWVRVPIRRLQHAVTAVRDGAFALPVRPSRGPAELIRLAESLSELTERMGSQVERLRSFVSYAGHQLGTPLATLELCAYNLRPAVGEDGEEDFAMLVDEVERIRELYAGLLTYARAEAAVTELDDVNISSIAAGRVRAWSALAQPRGVQVVLRGEDLVVARATTGSVGQCLDVLVDNAVKYAGDGSVVVVAVSRDFGGWARIDVVDDGPGLREEELARAAELFWRRPEDANLPGTGLGVAIADALVTSCGGTLSLLRAHPSGLHARIRLRAGVPSI
jgi:signal transduction histidine kinase